MVGRGGMAVWPGHLLQGCGGHRRVAVRELVVRRQLLVVGRQRPVEAALQLLQVRVMERRRRRLLRVLLLEGGAEALGLGLLRGRSRRVRRGG